MGVKIGYYFVPFPESIWDDNLQLTLGEFRLLGYLLRHQVGMGVKPALLTDDELLNGVKRADGTRRDQGCGLRGVNNLKDARRRLTERGWLDLKEDLTDRARPKRFYRVKVQPREQVSETDSWVSETDSDRCPKRIPQVSETDTRTKVDRSSLRPTVDSGALGFAFSDEQIRTVEELNTRVSRGVGVNPTILAFFRGWFQRGGTVAGLREVVEHGLSRNPKVSSLAYFQRPLNEWLDASNGVPNSTAATTPPPASRFPTREEQRAETRRRMAAQEERIRLDNPGLWELMQRERAEARQKASA